MPLIFGNRQLARFIELVDKARRIDIVVAWASSCDEIEALAASAADIRAVVGTSENSTNPSTLRHLNEFANLRIPPNNPPRIFHPKYYLFHGEKTVCWVGSANLTKGGSAETWNLSTSLISRERKIKSGLNVYGQIWIQTLGQIFWNTKRGIHHRSVIDDLHLLARKPTCPHWRTSTHGNSLSRGSECTTITIDITKTATGSMFLGKLIVGFTRSTLDMK